MQAVRQQIAMRLNKNERSKITHDVCKESKLKDYTNTLDQTNYRFAELTPHTFTPDKATKAPSPRNRINN